MKKDMLRLLELNLTNINNMCVLPRSLPGGDAKIEQHKQAVASLTEILGMLQKSGAFLICHYVDATRSDAKIYRYAKDKEVWEYYDCVVRYVTPHQPILYTANACSKVYLSQILSDLLMGNVSKIEVKPKWRTFKSMMRYNDYFQTYDA